MTTTPSAALAPSNNIRASLDKAWRGLLGIIDSTAAAAIACGLCVMYWIEGVSRMAGAVGGGWKTVALFGGTTLLLQFMPNSESRYAWRRWLTPSKRRAQTILLPACLVACCIPYYEFDAGSKFRFRVGGEILSEANPIIHGSPFNREWVSKWNFFLTDVHGRTADGQPLKAKVSATLGLGHDPAKWPWQTARYNSVGKTDYTRQEAFLERAFARTVGALTIDQIDRNGSLRIDVDTAMAIELEEAGLGMPGKLKVYEIETYFEAPAAKK